MPRMSLAALALGPALIAWLPSSHGRPTGESNRPDRPDRPPPLLAGGLSAAVYSPRPSQIVVQTLYDGNRTYRPHPSGGFVWSGPEAARRVQYNREFSEKDSSFRPFKRTREVIALHAAIHVRVKSDATPEEVWESARRILQWYGKHSKDDHEQYVALVRAGRRPEPGSQSLGDWPSVSQIARYYAEHRVLPVSACFSQAHMVFQLFRVCGLPAEDFGIASARYAKDPEGKQMREHVYLGLRVGGDWYYIDPSAKLPAPYARRASVGRKVGQGPGCDYAHPFSFKVIAGARFQAIPLLEPRPRDPDGHPAPGGRP